MDAAAAMSASCAFLPSRLGAMRLTLCGKTQRALGYHSSLLGALNPHSSFHPDLGVRALFFALAILSSSLEGKPSVASW